MVFVDHLDGTVAQGSASGHVFVDTPSGQGIRFSEATETKIEYSYDYFPRSGSLEMRVKVDYGYSYQNGTLIQGNSAVLFATDTSDVSWPGSAWLSVNASGAMNFQVGGRKYDAWRPEFGVAAENTGFTFGAWHTVSISFGAQGLAIALDGKILALNPTHTQTLAGGGNHSTSLGKPTIGEGTSTFWGNNQWDLGFAGVVDAVRFSSEGLDFTLHEQFDETEVSPPHTSAEIFERHGKLGFMALMAKAAYNLGPDEPRDTAYVSFNNTAKRAFRDVKSELLLLDSKIVGSPEIDAFDNIKYTETLDLNGGLRWNNGFGTNGNLSGIYSNKNAAALVGQSKDALFIAFRGTNDTTDQKDHWIGEGLRGREIHFRLFDQLFETLIPFISENIASGLNKIYLTGHSLGAAMVNFAYDRLAGLWPSVTVEGTNFASPGHKTGLDGDPDKNITNFLITGDVISKADILSTNYGQKVKFNDVLLGDSIFTEYSTELHAMEYYLAFSRFLVANARAEFNLPGDIDSILSMVRDFGLESIVTQFSGKVLDANGELRLPVRIAQGSDILIGGLLVDENWKKRDFPVGNPDRTYYVFNGSTFDSLSVTGQKFASISTTDASTLSVLTTHLNRFNKWLLASGQIEEALNKYPKTVNELMIGGAGDDVIMTRRGKDMAFGGTGNDILIGGANRDTLYGGADNDILIGHKDSKGSFLQGGAGNDIYVLFNNRDRFQERGEDGGHDIVMANHALSLSGTDAGGVEVGILLDPVGLLANDDFNLTGNALDNLLIGNAGDNVIDGSRGADTLYGNAGKDTLYGGSARDLLFGGIHKDTLDGGDGADTLDGGAGADVLTGGSGADVFVFASATEAHDDRITDFTRGQDRIDLSGIAAGLGLGALRFTGSRNDWGTGDVYVRQATSLFSGEQTTQVRINTDGGPGSEGTIILSGHHALTAADFILG